MNDKMKKAFHANSFKYGTFSLIMSVFLLVIIICVNLVMNLLPSAIVNVDITPDQNYSIGETTEKIVSAVKEDVTIYMIATEGSLNERFVQMTNRYEDLSPHIKVEHIDPDLKPTFLADHGIKAEDLSGKYTDIFVESARRSKFIPYGDIYEVDQNSYMMYMYGYSPSYDVTFDGEGEITSAISYVTTEDLPKMYLLTGHDEAELDTAILGLLDQNNITGELLNLAVTGTVPEDCDIIMIYKPTGDFSADEVDILENYIAHNGKCIIFNDAKAFAKMPNYKSLLKYYGVAISENSYIFEGSAYCITQSNGSIRYWLYEPLGNTDFTASLSGKYAFSPNSPAIITQPDKRKTLTISPILSTSTDSWLRTDMESKVLDEKISSDVDGPFDIAVSIHDRSNEGDGHVVVFSGDYFLEFSKISEIISNYANGDVFMNVLTDMVKLKARVSIPRKSAATKYNTFTTQEFNMSLVIFVIIIPVVTLIAGFIIWIVRRRR